MVKTEQNKTEHMICAIGSDRWIQFAPDLFSAEISQPANKIYWGYTDAGDIILSGSRVSTPNITILSKTPLQKQDDKLACQIPSNFFRPHPKDSLSEIIEKAPARARLERNEIFVIEQLNDPAYPNGICCLRRSAANKY